ncbi:MAG: LPS-assembly protein LptD [Saprospiraceae bacterium]|nr:LPS-assembly protein LptD [Saprospiraceae bacterium]
MENFFLRSRSWRWILSLLVCCSRLYAQDTIPKPATGDSLTKDSLSLVGTDLYVIFGDSIAEPVNYNSRDSIIFDYAQKWIHLYGAAVIKYQTMTINADYIKIDLNNNIVFADPLLDSLGKKTGIPHFEDGGQAFDAQSMMYNFKTRKGTIQNVVTKEADIYILGQVTKFIAKTGDSSRVDDVIFNQNGIFTTCDHPEPHFGIYSRKQKVIPNKLVIVGPSILKIQEIPMPPFLLPFGFFPISKDKSSGLIFPRNYVFDPNLGFGLQDVGYYKPINEYLDAKLLGSIWFKGSFKVGILGNYKKRYKNSGNFELSYSRLKNELPNDYRTIIRSPLKLEWRHSQDPTAHPYRSISGQTSIQVGAFDRQIYLDAYSQQNSNLRSSVTYNQTFPNSPFALVVGMNHDQNISTKIMNVTFPSVDLRMRAQTPFKRKKSNSSQQAWYEKITINYNSGASNRFTTYDSLLFTRRTLDTMRYGVRHTTSADASFRVLKYFNLTPRIDAGSEWFFNKQKLFLLDSFVIDTSFGRNDTLKHGVEQQILEKGFFALNTISSSLSLNTQIYGQLLSSKGWFRGIRHVVSPNVSMSYAPNYDQSPFGYYDYVNTDLRPGRNRVKQYLKYTNSPYGTSSVPSENFQFNFSINNRVEMKYYSKKDTNFKKISLIDNFTIGGNYNVFADSFKLSRSISGSGQTTLFKGLTRLGYTIVLDPYKRVLENGVERQINQYRIQADGKFNLFYLTRMDLSVVTSTTVPQLIQLFYKPKETPDPLPDLGSVFNTFGLNHTLTYQFVRLSSGKDTFMMTNNSFYTQGNIPLTKNWSVSVGSIGYDFIRKGLTYPDITLNRKLHCWNMRFSYYPQSNAFSFFIGVNPGPLDFVKIPSNQNFTGGR